MKLRLLICLALLSPIQPARAQQAAPPARAVLNIPATRLDVWVGDSLARSYRVAVGSVAYPTPTGLFEINELTWNPWWVPPPSRWAKGATKTPPGPNNPMGRVKIRFDDYLYLHGTPDVNSIGRAASHGCVRMRNRDAIDLAQFVLSTTGPIMMEDVLAEVLRDSTATLRILLDCKLPLEVRYDVVEVRGSMLEVHNDVYRRGINLREEILAALSALGYPKERIDTARLDGFLAHRKRPSDRVRIDALLVSPRKPASSLTSPRN